MKTEPMHQLKITKLEASHFSSSVPSCPLSAFGHNPYPRGHNPDPRPNNLEHPDTDPVPDDLSTPTCHGPI